MSVFGMLLAVALMAVLGSWEAVAGHRFTQNQAVWDPFDFLSSHNHGNWIYSHEN